MNKGTIIYYGGFSLPDKSASANRVVSNAKIFSACGYNTVFIGAAKPDESFNGLRAVDGYENMFEYAHPESTKQWLLHMVSVRYVEEIAEQFGDACKIILYNVPMFTLIKAKKVFAKRNIEVCYDCTEWTRDTDGSLPKRIFKAFDEILISNFAHKVADGMIVISRMMEEKYKSSKKLILLPPLVDTDDKIWHQTPEKHDGIFEFCFAGIPDGKKESLDKIVEAFLAVDKDNICLRIIGVTEDEFRQFYPDCSVSQKIRNRIIFMGTISHSESIRYILGCDCYIFIRRSDRRNNAGFPTKFAESFTCGVPIITTDVSDVGEYIKDSGKGCLLKNMTPESICEAMLYQIENKNQPNKLDKTFHYESFVQPTENWLK